MPALVFSTFSSNNVWNVIALWAKEDPKAAGFRHSSPLIFLLILVLERTQKIRTSNTRTLAFSNFEHLELDPKNLGRTRTSEVELRTSKKR